MLHFKLMYNFDINGAPCPGGYWQVFASGNQVFMCLYNLQKVFDLVEYPVFVTEFI